MAMRTTSLLAGLVALTVVGAACQAAGSGPAPGAGSATPKTTTDAKTVSAEKAAAPQGIAQIAQLKGPNRQELLIEGAKKEGKLTWYTTLIIDQAVRPLVDAFRKEYPFIEVEYWRGNDADVLQRVLNESRAKQFTVDVTDAIANALTFRKAGLLQPFESPSLDAYPAERKDPNRNWAITHLYFHTPGYNKNLVKPEELPKTWEDLLDPHWKGKMAWSTGTAGGSAFVGHILTIRGEEEGMKYLEKLAQQDVVNVNASARVVVDQLISGEYPLALHIFNHHAHLSARKGAPSEWLPIEPVQSDGSEIMLLNNAPHPHAAMLFLDFVLSERGQAVLRDADYIPAHPKVAAKEPKLRPEEGGFKDRFYSGEFLAEKRPEWQAVYQKLFVK